MALVLVRRPSCLVLRERLNIFLDGTRLVGYGEPQGVPVESEGEEVERLAAGAEKVEEGVEEVERRERDREEIGVRTRQRLFRGG